MMKPKLMAGAWLLSMGSAIAVVPAHTAGQHSSPEEAAIGKLGDFKGRVMLDRRFALPSGGKIEFGRALRSRELTDNLARMLNATLNTFEEVRVCPQHDPSKVEYPWSRCRLEGTDSFVGVSDPFVNEDEARVYVTVWSNSGNRIQQIAVAQWEILVRKKGGRWFFEKIVGMAMT